MRALRRINKLDLWKAFWTWLEKVLDERQAEVLAEWDESWEDDDVDDDDVPADSDYGGRRPSAIELAERTTRVRVSSGGTATSKNVRFSAAASSTGDAGPRRRTRAGTSAAANLRAVAAHLSVVQLFSSRKSARDRQEATTLQRTPSEWVEAENDAEERRRSYGFSQYFPDTTSWW